MFENLKAMTDDEVINVINNIVTDNMDVALADLKIILAEASGRKLEKKYINIIAERIKSKIQPEVVEVKRRPEQIIRPAVQQPKQDFSQTQAVQKPTFDDVYNTPTEEEVFEEEYEKFPALAFLSAMYKILAWVFLVFSIIGFIGYGILKFKGTVYLICASAFCGIITGLLLLLAFYALAESLRLRMDTEEHLRDIKKLLDK
ncbi:MAG: hypothetical protein IKV86_06165 [Clostridia bacterium]|nr:hypothetical protein [Clostridia bacterium]